MNATIIPIRPSRPLFNKALFRAAVKRAMTDTVVEGVRYVRYYPPTAPDQKYRRTGNLGRSWSFVVTQRGDRTEGVVGSNSNTAPYNREVQGGNPRPIFTRIGWRNVNDLAGLMERQLPIRVQAEIDVAMA